MSEATNVRSAKPRKLPTFVVLGVYFCVFKSRVKYRKCYKANNGSWRTLCSGRELARQVVVPVGPPSPAPLAVGLCLAAGTLLLYTASLSVYL